jgi:hypothetical protein
VTVQLSYLAGAGWQFFDDNGVPLSGGKLFVYEAGTTTKTTIYASNAGVATLTNPIILDAAGRVSGSNEVWLTAGASYKFVLSPSTDTDPPTSPIWTKDNVPSINDISDLANTSDNAKGDALIGFKQSNSSGFLSGAVASTVNNKLQEFVSILDFGAVSGDTGDQTTAIQNALNTANRVYLPVGTYRYSTTLDVPANTQVFGPGKLHYTGASNALSLKGSNIKLKDFTVYGAYSATYSTNSNGIFGQLSTFSPTTIVYFDNITIENVEVYNFGETGIRLDWIRNSVITNCNVHDNGYAGITFISPIRVRVTNNNVRDITPGLPNSGYGISLSRSYSSPALSTTDSPMPTNCVVANNTITNVLNYTGIDFHSGDTNTVSGNAVRNCQIGLNLEHATGGGSTVGVYNLVVTGNAFYGPTSTPRSAAIAIDAQSGASEMSRNITISGNTFAFHGLDSTSAFFPTYGGVIYARNVENLTVSSNTFTDCYGRAVAAYIDAKGVAISGNAVYDLTSVGGVQYAFESLDGDATMAINANVMNNAAGYLINASNINAGYGVKVGADNVALGGAKLYSTAGDTPANIVSGNAIMSPKVVVVFTPTAGSAGTVNYVAFENMAYGSADITVTRTADGDYTISWPAGIFKSANIIPVFSPVLASARITSMIYSISATSVRVRVYDEAAGALVLPTYCNLTVMGR